MIQYDTIEYDVIVYDTIRNNTLQYDIIYDGQYTKQLIHSGYYEYISTTTVMHTNIHKHKYYKRYI